MNNSSPYDHMPDEYAEDKPFRMSTPDHNILTEIEERSDSFPTPHYEANAIPFPRNHFFGGLCLAVPFSALLLLLVIYVL